MHIYFQQIPFSFMENKKNDPIYIMRNKSKYDDCIIKYVSSIENLICIQYQHFLMLNNIACARIYACVCI